MKIFSAEQIKRRDQATLKEEGISSEALMERAAAGCTEWILRHFPHDHFHIFCGTGNNGGDGSAIARMLQEAGRKIRVDILGDEEKGSEDFKYNLQRLKERKIPFHQISDPSSLPAIENSAIIIDALLGTGLNKPLTGDAAALVDHINQSGSKVIAIDIPSGVFCDATSLGYPAIKAKHTLSFSQKLAFMMAENESFTGRIHSIDIGLSKRFEDDEPSEYCITDREDLKKMIQPRPLFAHKGSFGHGALVAGSHGMMGAAILAASGFLRSGAGKLTCYVPECGYEIMQTSVPEAMCETSGKEKLLPFALKMKYDAIGAGPGMSSAAATADVLSPLLRSKIPLLLDADALNGMAADKKLLDNIPSTTIITPHPGEFDRLFGKTNNDFERLALAISSAKKHGLYVVLKGHHTAICTPEGKVHFNDTGNPGMAKPGMGDVLTGLLTGLLAQGYAALESCLLGVYIHGRAGDLAASQHSQQAMTAMHLVDELENVWKEFS